MTTSSDEVVFSFAIAKAMTKVEDAARKLLGKYDTFKGALESREVKDLRLALVTLDMARQSHV